MKKRLQHEKETISSEKAKLNLSFATEYVSDEESGTFQHWPPNTPWEENILPFQTLPEMEVKPTPLEILASLKRPSADSPNEVCILPNVVKKEKRLVNFY